MTSSEIQNRLHRIGQGACIAVWNGSFDVVRLEIPSTGQKRRILSSGRDIDAALFDRADERVAELKSRLIHESRW